MNYHILTLFPQMIMDGLNNSIIGRAIEKGLISAEAVNIRDFSQDKHNHVDDYPYGGGAGMVMQPGPVVSAYEDLAARLRRRPRVIYMTPQGKVFSQKIAEDLAKEEDLVFLCGHYEGIDERALDLIVTDYLSIGDYVLTGGELPAMVMIDCISRLVPGVLNNDESAEFESFHDNLLEYPQYTRPEVFQGRQVPQVLLNGDHRKIDAWRREQSIRRTIERRPDLMKDACLTDAEQKFADSVFHEQGTARRASYQVISLDLFQTLADVNARIPEIWKEILGEQYTDRRARAGAEAIVSAYPKVLKKSFSENGFCDMEEIYRRCAREALRITGFGNGSFSVTEEKMTQVILKNHSLAPLYEDVVSVLRELKKRFRLVLSSDASPLMAEGVLKRLEEAGITFEKVFLSDELKAWKGGPDRRFFSEVCRELKVKPEEILHIGDSVSDISGASKSGLHSCLISRDYRPYKGKAQPDYRINGLSEIAKLLRKIPEKGLAEADNL